MVGVGDFGIVDLRSGAYSQSAGGYDLEWVANGDRVVVAGDGYTEPGRVQVSRPDDPDHFVEATAGVSGPRERNYVDAAVSPEGGLVVAWEEELGGKPCCAALLDLDGQGFRPLAVTGIIQSMAFAPDGSEVYLTVRREGRVALVRYPRDGPSQEIRTLPNDLYAWESLRFLVDGSLALVGRTPGLHRVDEPGGCERDCPPYRSRVLLLDADTGTTRYESPDFDRFTSVAGLDLGSS